MQEARRQRPRGPQLGVEGGPFGGGRQFAVQQQVGDVLDVALGGELLHG